MKNILVISHMYPSSANGVLGIFVHKQVQKLITEGCKVKVVCPVPYVPKFLKISNKFKNYINIPDKAVIDGVEIQYPRYIEIPRGILLQYSGFLMYLGIKRLIGKINREFKFDVIHAHTAVPVGFASMLLNKKYKIPLIVTIHGQDFQYTLKKNEACKKSIMKVLSKAHSVITVSNKLKNMIKDEKILSKITVINNGINPEEYRDNDKNDNIEESKDCIILSVSSLIKTKGIDLNIKALSVIVKKYPNIKYYIIGDGEENRNLKKLVDDLSLNDNVVFLGKLPHSQVIKYMSKCSIFSLPSWQEGFGIVYIEAMNNGVPVIGVRGQGIEDVIIDKENGFLVESHNVEDLVKTIEYILENMEKAKAIGEKGKITVISEYTWRRNAQKTIDIYNNLLKNK